MVTSNIIEADKLRIVFRNSKFELLNMIRDTAIMVVEDINHGQLFLLMKLVSQFTKRSALFRKTSLKIISAY